MLTNTFEIVLNTQSALNPGVCNRCQESKLLNVYGLCTECDHQVDEEYEILYQEPLELDIN
jgi:hypothetical protein